MNIAAWLINTITVASRTGADSYGMATYGSQVSVPARVENRLTLALGGNPNLNSEHVIVTTTLINPDDRIWLPGDNTSDSTQARRPLKINNASTRDGGYVVYETYL